MSMISVEEALAYVLKHFSPLAPERVALLESLDRVLAEDVLADMNVPPLDNSAMDGYAVRAADIVNASQEHPVTLRVIGDLAAGYMPDRTVEPGTAVRIMTGAVLPPGADTVVRFEETSEGAQTRGAGKGHGTVEILKAIKQGDNVRGAGEDIRKGKVVLPKGTVIRPSEIGVLASIGQAQVLVHRRPRVAILATGDELVDVTDPVTPGKIRNSNEYTNAAAVTKVGGIPIRLGIARDNIQDLKAKIKSGLDQQADLFITSAGVSVGDYDMVKDVLSSEGEIQFWQVRMKPGKPLAFGILRKEGGPGVPLLGLPGNPVSAMVSFEMFARAAILTMLGKTKFTRPTVRAVLLDQATNDSNRRNFIRVHVGKENGRIVARTTGEQGSGILTSLSRANGLLVIPENVGTVPPGETVDVQMLDWPETDL